MMCIYIRVPSVCFSFVTSTLDDECVCVCFGASRVQLVVWVYAWPFGAHRRGTKGPSKQTKKNKKHSLKWFSHEVKLANDDQMTDKVNWSKSCDEGLPFNHILVGEDGGGCADVCCREWMMGDGVWWDDCGRLIQKSPCTDNPFAAYCRVRSYSGSASAKQRNRTNSFPTDRPSSGKRLWRRWMSACKRS